MNIRILLIILIGIGTLILGIGVYLLFKPDQQPQTVQTTAQPPASNTASAPTIEPKINRISKDITVPAEVLWFDTGIDVKNSLNIRYNSGTWTNGGDVPIWADANGGGSWNGLIVPSAPFRALVGKVKSNTFFVGKNYEGSPGTGRLFLSINDIADKFWDNKGQLQITVSVK